MEISLSSYWTAFGRIAAAFSGALIVLLGLLADVSLLAACGRGFAVFLAVRVLTRAGAWAIAWTAALELPETPGEPTEDAGA